MPSTGSIRTRLRSLETERERRLATRPVRLAVAWPDELDPDDEGQGITQLRWEDDDADVGNECPATPHG